MIPTHAPAPPALPYEHLSATANLTTRDYFAAKAMQGLVESGSTRIEAIAKASYLIADAMIRGRGA